MSKGIRYTVVLNSAKDYIKPYQGAVGLSDDSNLWHKYGDKDDYADVLLDLYRKCNTHNSIIRAKIDLALGEGLHFSPLEHLMERQSNGLYKKTPLKLKDRDIDDLISRAECFLEDIDLNRRSLLGELFIYGGAFITINNNIVSDLNGINPKVRTISASIQPHRFARVGLSDFLLKDKPKYNFYCRNFKIPGKVASYQKYARSKKKAENTILKLRCYEKGLKGVSSYYVRQEDSYRDVYGCPDYETEGSLKSIEADYELALFDNQETKNTFNCDYIITIFRLKKDTEQEEKAKQREEIEKYKGFKGGHNAGSVILQWSDDVEDKKGDVSIEEVPNNRSYKYVSEKRQSLKREILSAHGLVVPEIAGVIGLEAGGFSSQSEKISKALEMFQSSKIDPVCDIESRLISMLLQHNDLPIVARSIPKKVTKDIPINILMSDFSVDERRHMYGYPDTKN